MTLFGICFETLKLQIWKGEELLTKIVIFKANLKFMLQWEL